MRGPAYLVETPRNAIRYNGIVEVTGSIPVGSTNWYKGLADKWAEPFFIRKPPEALGSISPTFAYRPIRRPRTLALVHSVPR